MKKLVALLCVATICAGMAGCTASKSEPSDSSVTSSGTTSAETSEESQESSTSSSKDTSPLSDSEIKELYTNPDKFEGRTVTLSGQVFSEPEYDESGVYFQMFIDVENAEGNTIVAYPDPDFELESDDYVKLTGAVAGTFEGTNAFGGTVTAPQIIATELEKSSYAEVVAPALKTVELDDATGTQYGYTVSVTKIEFAENETRVYVTVNNNGSDTFSLYSFDAKVIQDGKQYEEESNYDADYPEVQSDLLPGATTEGIITFPAMEQKDLQIVLEAYSENYDEDIEPYTFGITVK